MRYLVCLVIAACGYPPLDGNTTRGDANGGSSDAGNGHGDAQSGCAAPVTYATPTMEEQNANFLPDTGMEPAILAYGGFIGAEDDTLFVVLFDTRIQAGTINLSSETNFGTCTACVVIGANCNGCRPEADVGTGTFYMATGGTLQITAASASSISGSLTNATFTHVTIQNSGSMPTLQSTPVGDGCATTIASTTFGAPVT